MLNPEKLKPMRGELIAKCIQPPETTRGGIWTPDYTRPLPTESEVLRVGLPKLAKNGAEEPCPFRRGQRVWHDKHKGRCLQIEPDWYLFLNFDDIVALREPEKSK